jgi:hypothetical protein
MCRTRRERSEHKIDSPRFHYRHEQHGWMDEWYATHPPVEAPEGDAYDLPRDDYDPNWRQHLANCTVCSPQDPTDPNLDQWYINHPPTQEAI